VAAYIGDVATDAVISDGLRDCIRTSFGCSIPAAVNWAQSIRRAGICPPHFLPRLFAGLAFHNGYALAGLSLPRDGSFSGLALDAELRELDVEPWCGVQIIELATGNIVEWIRLEGGVTELFDVQVIPGVRHATAIGILNDDIQRFVTFGAAATR
jgi:uncharacterized protein (TIGR03032 family)